MLYHYTFATYLRKPLLQEEEIRVFLKNVFLDIAKDKGFEIIELEILSEHVHVLIEQSYLLSVSAVMKSLKGASARRLFQKCPTNRFEIRKLWGRSFDARKIGQDAKETVVEYIKNQKDAKGADKRFSSNGAGARIYSRGTRKGAANLFAGNDRQC